MSVADNKNAAWAKGAARRHAPELLADTSGFGFRMLAKMGWTAGKGLGRNEDGAAKHVQVERRDESLGASRAVN